MAIARRWSPNIAKLVKGSGREGHTADSNGLVLQYIDVAGLRGVLRPSILTLGR
jgi:hypothetical protein